ncbi:MAG: hypothetical protein AAB337_00765 [Patescibacteria group bacterium]
MLVVFQLYCGTARAEDGADLRTIHRVIHEILAYAGTTPDNGHTFLRALRTYYPEGTAMSYGALTALDLPDR